MCTRSSRMFLFFLRHNNLRLITFRTFPFSQINTDLLCKSCLKYRRLNFWDDIFKLLTRIQQYVNSEWCRGMQLQYKSVNKYKLHNSKCLLKKNFALQRQLDSDVTWIKYSKETSISFDTFHFLVEEVAKRGRPL